MLILIFFIIAVLAVWYLFPTRFLSGIEADDVKSISVFDGNTGKAFDISDADEILYIVENIQSSKMKKDKISIFYSGYSFRMSFYNEEGKKIENFIMNDNYTIRKDPFFTMGTEACALST